MVIGRTWISSTITCDIMEYLSSIASKIWLNLSSDFVIYRIQNMAKSEFRFSQIMANLNSDLAKLWLNLNSDLAKSGHRSCIGWGEEEIGYPLKFHA